MGRREPREDPVPRQGAAELPDPPRLFTRCLQLRTCPIALPGLQVAITQPRKLRGVPLQTELPADVPAKSDERVERVRDAAVAPIEEAVALVVYQDVAVVEVVVLHGLGDAVAGKLVAQHRKPRREGAQTDI